MSEGETAPVQATRQSNLNPPYLEFPGQPGSHPMQQLKSKTRYGVMFMFYAVLMLLISSIFSIIFSILITIYYQTFTYSIVETMIFLGIFSGLSLLLFLMFFVLLIVSTYFFSSGKREFGGEHQENVRWGRIFLVYILLF